MTPCKYEIDTIRRQGPRPTKTSRKPLRNITGEKINNNDDGSRSKPTLLSRVTASFLAIIYQTRYRSIFFHQLYYNVYFMLREKCHQKTTGSDERMTTFQLCHEKPEMTMSWSTLCDVIGCRVYASNGRVVHVS